MLGEGIPRSLAGGVRAERPDSGHEHGPRFARGPELPGPRSNTAGAASQPPRARGGSDGTAQVRVGTVQVAAAAWGAACARWQRRGRAGACVT